jgi:hypothetical protein
VTFLKVMIEEYGRSLRKMNFGKQSLDAEKTT